MKRSRDIIFHRLEPRTVKVYVIGDVHVGACEFEKAKFEKQIREIEEDPDAYVVFIGDLMDAATKDSVGDIYTARLNPSEQKQYLVEVLYNLAKDGKILAVIGGNHEQRITRATSLYPLYDVCVSLGIGDVYRPNYAAVKIRMGGGKRENGKKKYGNIEVTYSILCLHGASDSKMLRLAECSSGFDAVCGGHTHKPRISRPAHLVCGINEVKTTDTPWIVGCSWLDWDGYAARNGYEPQCVCRPQYMVCKWVGSNNQPKDITIVW